MALPTQPARIPLAWGENGTVGTIPETTEQYGYASWDQGFPEETSKPLTDGGIPPRYLDFQGVLHVFSQFCLYQQSGAAWAWSNAQDYPKGANVVGSDDNVYSALLVNGPSTTVVDPVGDTSGTWVPYVLDAEQAKSDAAEALETAQQALEGAVLITGDQTVAGVKNFTSSPLVPTLDANSNTQEAVNSAWVVAQAFAKNITVVHNTGDETVGGTKTFSASPLVPTPATNDNTQKVVNSAWVIAQAFAKDNAVVKLTGNQTIAGTKTFSSPIAGSITGNAATADEAIKATQDGNGNVIATTYANNSAVVHKSGDETVNGVKTFVEPIAASITGNAATADEATKAVQDGDGNVITDTYITNEDWQADLKPVKLNADIAYKNSQNLLALANGVLYREETDSAEAYTKTVPAGAQKWAALEKIGGKTVVWNQLFQPKRNQIALDTYTINGVTFTNNHDGSWTLSGTASTNITATSETLQGISGHKYLCKGCPAGGSDSTYSFGLAGFGVDFGNGGILNWSYGNVNTNGRLGIRSGIDVTGLVWTPRIYDLTLMFGAGNEPATVAEFEAMFPTIDPAYNAGELMSVGVTQAVSKDANDTTLATLTIPSAIQSLTGYGWSAGSAYNYVDFERKVYVQRVGRAVIDGVNVKATDINLSRDFGKRFSIPYGTLPAVLYNGANTNIVSTPIEAGYNGTVNFVSEPTDRVFTYSSAIMYGSMSTGSNCTSIEDMNVWFTSHPVTVYYELATPIETDISEYLTDDNLIEVEAGGTLTFKNQLDDDYRLPVPNEETYLISATPEVPAVNGTYSLQCTVTDGDVSYSWVSA